MLHDDVHGDRVRWGSNRVRCVSATGPGVSVKVRSSASAVLGASAYAATRKESRAPIHARKLQSARMQTVTCTTFFG